MLGGTSNRPFPPRVGGAWSAGASTRPYRLARRDRGSNIWLAGGGRFQRRGSAYPQAAGEARHWRDRDGTRARLSHRLEGSRMTSLRLRLFLLIAAATALVWSLAADRKSTRLNSSH